MLDGYADHTVPIEFDADKKESWLFVAGYTVAEIESMSQGERWAALTTKFGLHLQKHLVPLFRVGVLPTALLSIQEVYGANQHTFDMFMAQLTEDKSDAAVVAAYGRAQEQRWAQFDPSIKECWLLKFGMSVSEICALNSRERFAAVTRCTGLQLRTHLIPLTQMGVSAEFILKRHANGGFKAADAEKLMEDLKKKKAGRDAAGGDSGAGEVKPGASGPAPSVPADIVPQRPGKRAADPPAPVPTPKRQVGKKN